jgi:ATP-binding cassette subfamily C protein LapB
MDDEQERRCLHVLSQQAQQGKTLLIVTHKSSVLPLVNRIIVVSGNSIVMDGPRDAVLNELQLRHSQTTAEITPQPTFVPAV